MHPSILTRFQEALLVDASATYLLAVSGGVDSVVLAHLAHSAKLSFAIAHVNYGLRGEDSSLDEASVRALAAQLSVPCFVHHAADAMISASNIQQAARDIRYAFFKDVMHQHGYHYLLTAHHANDQAETLLINQLRGTGISGLKGIPSVRGVIRRPLLQITKVSLLAYASEHSLTWREDASNQTDDYLRNQLRHSVLPALETIKPNVVETFAQNAWFVEKQNRWIVELMNSALPDLVEENEVFQLNLLPFLQFQEAAMGLFMRMRRFSFDLETCEKIIASTHKNKVYQSATHDVIRVGDLLLVAPRNRSIPAPFQLESLRTFAWGNRYFSFEEPADSDRFGIDPQKLTFPLTVRPWQAGDVFRPVGLGGRKKVADLLTDLKFDLFQKEQVFVVCSGGEIVSVSDLRISEAFACAATEPQAHRIRINTL